MEEVLDEGFVFDSGFFCGFRYFFAVGDVGVWVCFEDYEFSIWGKAEVYSAVIADSQDAVDLFADAFYAVEKSRLQIGVTELDVPFFAILFIPFYAVGGQAGAVGVIGLEVALSDGQDF